MPVIEILRRAVTRMAEILVLGIPYFEQALHEGILPGHNGPEGETVNPASAAALLRQGGPPGNGGGDGNVVLVILLLEIGPKAH